MKEKYIKWNLKQLKNGISFTIEKLFTEKNNVRWSQAFLGMGDL